MLACSMLKYLLQTSNSIFDDVTVERAQYGFQTGLSVNNLKKGVTYTAYAYTEPTCDGVTVTAHPAVKLVAASDSYRVDGDPMDGVTFSLLHRY